MIGFRRDSVIDLGKNPQQVLHYDSTGAEQPGQDVNYEYDNPDWNAWGRLSSVTFGAGTYEYEYNIAGRVTAHRLVRDDGGGLPVG